MSDELVSPIELAKLTSDIQKAVQAFSEFQTHLTDVTKPLQAQWGSVSKSVQSFLEQMQSTADVGRQWAEDLQKAQKDWQGKIGEWSSIWAEAQAALAKQIAEAEPRIRRSLERADHVGRLGWTMSMSMTPADMVRLSAMASAAEADAYMLSWYETRDVDLNRMEQHLLNVKELEAFRTPISQCFAAYRRGDYALTIACLMAIFERGIKNLGAAEHFFNTKIQKMVKDLYRKAEADDPEAIEVFVWMSLYAFVQSLYEQYGAASIGVDRLFRNGIQHGTQPPPNERVEVLRLFHALQTVSALYPDGSQQQ